MHEHGALHPRTGAGLSAAWKIERSAPRERACHGLRKLMRLPERFRVQVVALHCKRLVAFHCQRVGKGKRILAFTGELPGHTLAGNTTRHPEMSVLHFRGNVKVG